MHCRLYGVGQQATKALCSEKRIRIGGSLYGYESTWGIDLKVTQVTRHSNTAKNEEMQEGRGMKREAVLHYDLKLLSKLSKLTIWHGDSVFPNVSARQSAL